MDNATWSDEPIKLPPVEGFDPIAAAEEEGSQAYKDGYDLKEAIEEYSIDTDTDVGMAFVQAFKETKEVAERS